jgi:hypothetical protein
MGYTTNVRSVYRNGYRPVGRTDTFASTHLGSVGTGVQIFGPARLHGLGQHRPFTDSGGYMLHGMGTDKGGPWGGMHGVARRRGSMRSPNLSGLGAMVPDQSILNYVGTWTVPATFEDAASVMTAVVSALEQDGLEVRSSSTSGSMFSAQFTANLQIQVNNGMGFSDPNDVISIVRHEVYVATGSMPVADSIPTVQTPGAAAAVSTGQPVPVATAGSANPINFTAWLEQNAEMIGIGAAALVLLPMFLGRR